MHGKETNMTTPTQPLNLIFLGTGGGRFATITQKRRTGGIRILHQKANIHLDPGPGALVCSLEAKLTPDKINGLLVSHCHPDHYNDAEVFIEAMTRGGTKKTGTLAAAHSVLYGSKNCEPSISTYHQQMPEQIIDAKPGTTFNIENLHITAVQAKHTDPDAIGFRIQAPTIGDVAYTSDSEYFEGISKPYTGVRVLILCVLRPSGSPWKGHMTTDDAVKIAQETEPEMTVLTHFGMQIITKNPNSEAQQIQQKTGIETIAATDGMHMQIGQQIQILTTRKQKSINEFL